jgi:hypothetical protein
MPACVADCGSPAAVVTQIDAREAHCVNDALALSVVMNGTANA